MLLIVWASFIHDTETVIPGYRVFIDKANGTSIDYPENWTMQTGQIYTIATFYPPGQLLGNSNASVELAQDHIGSSPNPARLYDLYQFGIHESFVMDFRTKSSISGVTNTTMAGRPAYIINYTRMIDNRTVNGTIIYTLKNSWFDNNISEYTTRYYVIEYRADEKYFDKYSTEALSMMNSFKFL